MKLKISILGLLLMMALNIGAMKDEKYKVLAEYVQNNSDDFIEDKTTSFDKLVQIPGFERIQVKRGPILDLAQDHVKHLQQQDANKDKNPNISSITPDTNNNMSELVKEFNNLKSELNNLKNDPIIQEILKRKKNRKKIDLDGYSVIHLAAAVFFATLLTGGGTYYFCMNKK